MTQQSDKKTLIPRPPVVVVMGHVDHGKTSLLDYIRKTNVVGREAGGITQSIGAYEVTLTNADDTQTNAEKNLHESASRKITFIDTPGHEAFSRMRARGAVVADIAVLVVATDDGPQLQTKEAIKILNDTKTPYVVAFTKIDKSNADIERAKNLLLAENVPLEGSGGNISSQGISIKTGEGIKELLNLILLLGELEELTSDPSLPGRGYIIESHKETRRGVVATFILKNGRLEEGDEVGTESVSGKIKILENFKGERVKELFPSAPGVMIGFDKIPKIGEEFIVGRAPELDKKNIDTKDVKKEGPPTKFKTILKADTSGSLEALKQIVETMADIVDASVGEINSSDIKNAMATGSIVLNFGSKIEKSAENLARIHNVKIFTSDIIYRLIESLDAYIKGGEGPAPIGELLILKVFGKKGKAQIVGGKVNFGVIKNQGDIRIWRGTSEIGKGKIINLQAGKKDVQEITEGEGGLLTESSVEIKEGDLIKGI